MISMQEEIQIMEDTKERALKELHELNNKYKDVKELPKEVLCQMDQLAHIVKSVSSNQMVTEQSASDYGYSGRSYRSYNDGNFMPSSYDGGMSQARGRGANGQYVSRDGWSNYGGASGHGYLEQMIQNAPDMETRRVLEMARENMSRR